MIDKNTRSSKHDFATNTLTVIKTKWTNIALMFFEFGKGIEEPCDAVTFYFLWKYTRE